jgi:hypothetical protein
MFFLLLLFTSFSMYQICTVHHQVSSKKIGFVCQLLTCFGLQYVASKIGFGESFLLADFILDVALVFDVSSFFFHLQVLKL